VNPAAIARLNRGNQGFLKKGLTWEQKAGSALQGMNCMNDNKVFVDTTILIYAYDVSAGAKHTNAARILRDSLTLLLVVFFQHPVSSISFLCRNRLQTLLEDRQPPFQLLVGDHEGHQHAHHIAVSAADQDDDHIGYLRCADRTRPPACQGYLGITLVGRTSVWIRDK